MPRKHSVHIGAIVAATEPALMLRYLERVGVRDPAPQWLHINGNALDAFLADDANSEIAAIVLEDFERIDELSRGGVSLLVRAYDRFGLEFGSGWSPHDMAWTLFLDHPTVFAFARTHYALRGGTGTLNIFAFTTAEGLWGASQCFAFESDIRAWFVQQAKGHEVRVTTHAESDEHVILVQRGHYQRTLPAWTDGSIAPLTFRASIEDVLAFDLRAKELRVKTSTRADCVRYVELFAKHFLGHPELAQPALDTQVFSLEPIRNQTFDYRGRGPIKKVDLVSVKLVLPGYSRAILNVQAANVHDALHYDLPDVQLATADLVSAKLRFHVQQPGMSRARQLTITVTPPGRTELAERRDINLVTEYLRRQQVMLR